MKKKIQVIVGLLIGLFLMWFLFRDTQWGDVWAAFKNADSRWLLVGLFVILLGFVVRIWRWSYIVNPVTPVPFWRLFSATQIGFLGNFVLPARIGEVIRALALSRSQKIPFPQTMAYVALDRLTDLFGLAAVFILTLFFFYPQQDVYLPEEFRNLYADPISKDMLRKMVYTLTFAVIIGVLMLMILFAKKELILSLSDKILGLVSKKLANFVHKIVVNFTAGMQVLTSYGNLAKSGGISLLLWGTFALSQMAMYKAFGIDLPWYAPFVVLSVLSILISIPGPPGFIGPFHAGIVGGLILVSPEINLNTARAVAIVAHLYNLIPILIIGVICLFFERIELGELSRKGEAIVAAGSEEDSNPS
ncbi:MAG: lysylphosphatidylglycerol synthase transmembrane domain-containing protein [Candidatus Hydrogenedentales bacterium]